MNSNGRMRHACALLLLLTFVQAPLSARAQTAPHASGAAQPAAATGKIETIRLESKLTGRAMPYHVLLPAGYESPTARATRHPVLFLLHGYTGHYDSWLKLSKLAAHAAPYSLIVVTPEGGNGWYTDSAAVPADKYESYVVEELLPDVARRYRTIDAREGRAVAGLSMGGYGALKFGVKHPGKFALAASMSGAVGAASWNSEADLSNVGPALRRSLFDTFGPPGSPTKNANDLLRLVRDIDSTRAAALPFLYLDCGTEDELGLLPQNRALADLFVEKRIAHEYRQLPGKHNWAYWDKQVQEVLRLAVRTLAAPRPAAATAAGAR